MSNKGDFFVTPVQYGLPHAPSSKRLTPLDMNMPRLYGARWILCFPLHPEFNKTEIYEDLKAGLAHTITSIPWISGSIGPEEGSDPAHNRIQITDSLKGVRFPCNDLTGILPSYEELKDESFPLSKLSTAQFGPIGIFSDPPEPVLAAQANFIKNGLLLAVGVHHSACDASALDYIVNTWAQNTAAVSSASSFSTFDTQSNDRCPLMEGMPGAKLSEFPEYTLVTSTDTSVSQFPPHMPPLTSNIFYFSADSLAILKSTAAAFSTNDALCAFIWQHITIARKDSGAFSTMTTDEVTSTLAYAVNIRGRMSPPLPPTYLGNASMVSTTRALPISVLEGDAGLTFAASTIRKSLVAFGSPSRVPLTIGLLNSRPNSTSFKLSYNAFLGPDVVATSWADLKVRESDWGKLGAIESFRVPGEGSDGFVMVFPRLKEGGLEVVVGLQNQAMEKLLQNTQFRKVAQLLP